MVADLARGRHVDRAREALEEVGEEGGGGPRLADELDRKLAVVQGGEGSEEGERESLSGCTAPVTSVRRRTAVWPLATAGS